MKQHITIDQLNELSEDGKKRLSKWWWHVYFSRKLEALDITAGVTCEDHSKDLLSIGQMIELLNYNGMFVECTQWLDKYRHWQVGVSWIGKGKSGHIRKEPELADALWSACKEVLEENE